MTWFAVDDSFHSHPKALASEPAALGLWVIAGSWCCSNLTDGFVPDYALPRLAPGASELAEKLVTVGLWRRAKGGYRFHDWSDYQESKEERLRKREEWRKKKAGQRSAAKGKSNNTRSDGELSPGDAPRDSMRESPGGVSRESRVSHSQSLSPSKEGLFPAPAVDFDAFWAVYPRKEGKKGAEKAWQKAIKDGADPSVLVEAASRYRDAKRGEITKFKKTPIVWLNQGCWEDESEPAPPAADDEINPDEVLGFDYWSPPSPPREVAEGPHEWRQEWYAQRRAERHTQRVAEARAVLARRTGVGVA